MMNLKTTFLIALVLLVIVACSPAKLDISGEWKLVSYGAAANPTPAIPNVDTSINFDLNGHLNGNVGCNSFGGNYEIRGEKITFNSIRSTMMYCEETSAQEQGLLGIFSDNTSLQIKVNGDTLTITSADGVSAINLARK
jgi:heat shock protein HslJ